MVNTTIKPSWLRVAARACIATAVSLLASCLFCVAVNYETLALGLLVAPFVLPSVVLYLLVQRLDGSVGAKWLAFLGPAAVIAAPFVYGYCFASAEAIADGADEMLLLAIECFGIGLIASGLWIGLGDKLRGSR